MILHNSNLIDETSVYSCPFSDHDFITASLNIVKPINSFKTIKCRNLCQRNIDEINKLVQESDLKSIFSLDNVEQKWTLIKNELTKILNQIAPIKSVRLRNSNLFPWFDDELLLTRHYRDCAYKKFIKTGDYFERAEFLKFKKLFKDMNDQKMIEYFKNQKPQDFKNSKKFWQFYSSKVKIKSDNSANRQITSINYNSAHIDSKNEISELFNCYFTSIKSSSTISDSDSTALITDKMSKIVQATKISCPGFSR